MKYYKICFPETTCQNNSIVGALIRRGHLVTPYCDDDYDCIWNASAFNMQWAQREKAKHPKVPIIQYVWDYYKYCHEGRHWFNWKPYAEFLKKSDKILVPSNAQKLRLKELLGLDSEVVHTGIDIYNLVRDDKRFVLDHMRWYEEPNKRWIVDACDQQGIQVLHPNHTFDDKMFKTTISACTFLACGYQEASTGGLTIIEGLWNGKPTLLSDSPYMGGKDYLGEFGFYFKWDDFEDCKRKVREMFNDPPKIDLDKAQDWIRQNFTWDIMAGKIEKVIQNL